MLVVGSVEDALADQLSRLVPTIHFASDRAQLALVRQGDFDAAVLWRTDADLAEHLNVLQFGGEFADVVSTRFAVGQVAEGVHSVAAEFEIPEGVPDAVAALVRQDLAQLAVDREWVPTLGYNVIAYYHGSTHNDAMRAFIKPFLRDFDGLAVAGRYERPGGNSEWWRVPDFVSHPERWAAVALDVWRERDPDRFPAEASWQQREEWRTDTERRLLHEQQRLRLKRSEADRRFAEALAQVGQKLQEAEQHAEENERRLLTAQGDDLVAEVVQSLREIGFEVIDVDAQISSPGDRREDIRVLDPSAPGWIALGEVRGYARGAQLNDLLRLTRFVTRFVRDEGREPDATWYVVNQMLATDPATRPLPLEANPEEVETFAEDGGLILDTRELFALRMKVRQGQIGAEEARRLLRGARKRLT